MKRFFSRIGRGILRFFLRHWAGAAIVLLLLLAAFTGYQMWRLGPVMALSLLPQLILCLVLVVAVIAVRRVIKALTTKNVVESGVAQGRAALKTTAQEAKEALASLGAEVKRAYLLPPGGGMAAASQATVRCASCGRVARPGAKFCEGCGAALFAPCPKCGRAMPREARFCTSCGARLGRKG